MPCWNQFPNPIPETSSENGSRNRPSEPVPDRLPEQLLETDTGDSLALGAYASLQPDHIAWWTGRDLNPRPYGAGLVPSRKQGRYTTGQAGEPRPEPVSIPGCSTGPQENADNTQAVKL